MRKNTQSFTRLSDFIVF